MSKENRAFKLEDEMRNIATVLTIASLLVFAVNLNAQNVGDDQGNARPVLGNLEADSRLDLNTQFYSDDMDIDETILSPLEYPYGDVNNDGWCNEGDIISYIAFLMGWSLNICSPACDVNGDSGCTGSDVSYLYQFFADETSDPPQNAGCTTYVSEMGVGPGGSISHTACSGNPNETDTIDVFLEATNLGGVHFSLGYNQSEIDSIKAIGFNDPLFNGWTLICRNMGCSSSIMALTGTSNFNGINIPPSISAFSLEVFISSDAYTGFHMLNLSTNSIWGPAKMYHIQDYALAASSPGIDSSSIDSVKIGNLWIHGGSINDLGSCVYSISESVNINHILNFDGTLTVDIPNLTITGNCAITINNIPHGIGNLQIYSGQINFSVQELNLLNLIPGEGNHFAVGGFDLRFTRLSIIPDGIRVAGGIEFPKPLSQGGKIDIDSLSITTTGGIEITGSFCIPDVNYKAINFSNMCLIFNTAENKFGGTLMVATKLVKVGGELDFIIGRLNRILLSVEVDPGVPIGTTGLNLSGGSGEVDNLATPEPIIIGLAVDITGTLKIAGRDIVKLNDLGLRMQVLRFIEGFGELQFFEYPVARGRIKYSNNSFDIYGSVSLSDIFYAGLNLNLNSSMVFGSARGRLSTPSDLPFWLRFARNKVIGYVNADVRNRYLWAEAGVPISFNRRANIAVQLEFGKPGFPYFYCYIGTNYGEMHQVFISGLDAQDISEVLIPAEIPQAIFYVAGTDYIAPDFQLIAPDSTVITPADSLFLRYDDDKLAMFVIDDPAEGLWQIHADNQNDDSLTIEAYGQNNAPVIQVTEPSENTASGLIEWLDMDIDDDAEIMLCYDNDNSGFNGVPITDIPLSEDDLSDSYLWDYSQIPSGKYYIYAVISDTMNAPVRCYSPGTIEVIDMEAPARPEGFNGTATDSSIQLNWQPNTEDDLYGYVIYYTDDNSNTGYENPWGVEDTTECEITGIPTGRTYRLALTAFDSLGHESVLSESIFISLENTTLNDPPHITSVHPPTSAIENGEYKFGLTAEDVDFDLVSFSLTEYPLGMSITSDTIQWIPDSSHLGNHFVTLYADDGNGGLDSLSFIIHVANEYMSVGLINLDRRKYRSYSDPCFITVEDYDLDINQFAIDSIAVSLISDSDPAGITVYCYENAPNSANFVGTFTLSDNSSNDISDQILVVDGDTILTTYNDVNPIQDVEDKAVFVISSYNYLPGDVNMSAGTWPPAATGPDVTYLVNYFRGAPTSHSCLFGGFWCSADANGDCNIIGSDVTKLVNVFRGIGGILYCGDYEPSWHSPSELPPSAPSSWPNCGSGAVTGEFVSEKAIVR